jgi:hypothetical protein
MAASVVAVKSLTTALFLRIWSSMVRSRLFRKQNVLPEKNRFALESLNIASGGTIHALRQSNSHGKSGRCVHRNSEHYIRQS